MQIKSKTIEMILTDSLIHHPKNPNKHSDEQITRLCKLISYQGFRNPLIVQMGTDLVVAGNGRLMAAKQLGLKEVPVIYQEFDSEAQLYAYIVADNEIARWASLDRSMVLDDLKLLDLGDIELLGLKDFNVLDEKVIEDTLPPLLTPKYKIEVEANSEDSRKNLHQELEGRGFLVRAV